MSIFNFLTLFGGLAMFLYGMRIMGNGLRESSSGTLKQIMEKVTNNIFKAFLLGMCVTALIQSSTATIVITSGLVAAGVITLRQSLGIIAGANVGTTVTGQIIRLLDIDSGASAVLQFFRPSTLAPVALILGILFIMFIKFRNSETVGSIAMGFGILFTGLLNMTGAVDSLAEGGAFDVLFESLGNSPVIGYLTGAGVAFILQSSSATIGILQTFAMSGRLTFGAIYAVVVGIYLGDCVTTAIVCSVGAKQDAKRVGIVNILFNLGETVIVLVVVGILHSLGLLNGLWNAPISSGGIANTNTVFNLGCSILLFPVLPVLEKLSCRIIKGEKIEESPYADKISGMNTAFFSSPALAFNSVYEVLCLMLEAGIENYNRAVGLLGGYDASIADKIEREEQEIDNMADKVSSYLVQLSPHISADNHTGILNHYYTVVSEFERIGDHAVNIMETAQDLDRKKVTFSHDAMGELRVLDSLLNRTLQNAKQTFRMRDVDTAALIEPMEEVVDDLVDTMHENHLARMRAGICHVDEDSDFLNLLTDMERISDICSNIGIATIVRAHPEIAGKSHDYINLLHAGADEKYNKVYASTRSEYFGLLELTKPAENNAEA